MTVSIAIAFHSGYGHTERQARAVAAGVDAAPEAKASLLDVSTLDDALWACLADADAIIFGTPTYMGTSSAVFQTFAEASSTIWAEGGWRDKLAAGFTNSAGINGDKLNTLATLSLFAAQHGMTWISLALPPGGQFTMPAPRTNSTGWRASWARWPSRRRTPPPPTLRATRTCAPPSTWVCGLRPWRFRSRVAGLNWRVPEWAPSSTCLASLTRSCRDRSAAACRRWSLLTAVSEGGGLGSFGAHILEAAEISDLVAQIKARTAAPFAINLWVPQPGEEVAPDAEEWRAHVARVRPYLAEFGLPDPKPEPGPGYDDQIAALLGAAPPVISFVMGIPSAEVLAEARSRGIHTIGTATTVDEAVAIEAAGLDAVVASGSDAGGHRGAFLRPVEESLVGNVLARPAGP